MNAEFLFDTLRSVGFVGICILILCIGEGVFNLLYRISPVFHRWIDNYFEGFPDWGDEEESE